MSSKLYIAEVGKNFEPNVTDDVMDSLFNEYERVIVQSLITSFGLDFIVKDRHGGDVDTIHNVRKIGTDEKMEYKNKANEEAYNNRGEYNSYEYHHNKTYIETNRKYSQQKKEGKLVDSYTGETVAMNANMDLDHVIAAKAIHDDRGRVLAGLSGVELANCDENLKPTDRSINRSMGKKDIDEYIKRLEDTREKRREDIAKLKSKQDLTDKERKTLNKLEKLESADAEKMKKAKENAEQAYEDKVNGTYYTSYNFKRDVTLAAGKVGFQMGIRQSLGFVFTEIWFAVKDEFRKIGEPFDFADVLNSVGTGIKKGVENAKIKYDKVLSKFKEGALAGILSSLTTTLCNIFFTTAKNTVRIIRQSYSSLVEAAKVLFINPDNYTFGERMRATSKIIAAGASVIVGNMVSEAISKTAIASIPQVGPIVQSFCGTLVSGIMSCTLLYFLDRSEIMNKLAKVLDKINTISTEVDYFKRSAEFFERYAAELMDLDIEKFKHETGVYNLFVNDIDNITDDRELNRKLDMIMREVGIKKPWQGDFREFMGNKNNRLVFE